MGMSVGGGEGEAIADINVTPLVDVMLVLLIIFMITAPLMSHKVKVDLPEVTAIKNNEEPGTITVALQSSGGLYWNDQPLTHDTFEAQLRIEARRQPQPNVQIRADRTTQYREVASIMAIAKNAGMKKVGLITSPAI